jgi:Na+-transporting methylmalonyl-CoA/oxaloacetate decarboxylase beta subunit
MKQLRPVSKIERVLFPLVVLGLCILLLPTATPLIGALMFGNIIKESGVTERLNKTLQSSFIDSVTILLGLVVGSKLQATYFLRVETIGILLLGLVAFSIGTMMGGLAVLNVVGGGDLLDPGGNFRRRVPAAASALMSGSAA